MMDNKTEREFEGLINCGGKKAGRANQWEDVV